MKTRFTTKALLSALVALFLFSFSAQAQEAVDVTFKVNTATALDTINSNHVIQMRGTSPTNTDLDAIITWDGSSLQMTNEGGDYWTTTIQMNPGDTLEYKFWAGSDTENGLVGNGGWETTDNKKFALPADASGDTTLPLHFFNKIEAPFESKDDSVAVWFRVNVGYPVAIGDFSPDTTTVGVRGSKTPLTWDDATPDISYEGNNGVNEFYSGVIYFAKSDLTEEANFEYKFYINDANGWESTPNRVLDLSSLNDTTVHFVYYSDQMPPTSKIVNTTLNFDVNVGILEGLGYFNSSIDEVYVRGVFNGWGEDNQMTFNNDAGTYNALNIPFNSSVGSELEYKFYVRWDESRDDEASEFYLPISADGDGWEEPGVTGGGNRILVIQDAESQTAATQYYNGVAPQALMTPANVEGGAITVTFSIDMTPALENESQPFLPASDSVYLIVDTPFFALTQDIKEPGDDLSAFVATYTDEDRERLRFTDEDGDMVYELEYDMTLPTLNHIGFRVAYGEPTTADGSLFVHGSGFDAGRRHYQYVQPIITEDGDDLDNLPDVSWPSSYTFPTLTWKVSDLDWETPPNYSQIGTSVEDVDQLPNTFKLNQNYPNPFNPTTTIAFELPVTSNVKLNVYNAIGQHVATLVNGKPMSAGVHAVGFNASGLASGLYIYRLEAGDFMQTRSMMLVK
jgi:hypothetical protein